LPEISTARIPSTYSGCPDSGVGSKGRDLLERRREKKEKRD
jgi:hypothetical protein